MKTDSLFYQLFQTYPRCFFDLLGLPSDTVERYRFASVEVKQLAFRIDGIFLPNNQSQPVYFLEVQFQRDTKFYSRFFSEIFLYLRQSDSGHNWRGIIIYPRRGVDSGEIEGYESLLDSERVSRFYLDELEEIESMGINTLKLIAAPEPRAIEGGKALIRQIRQEFTDPRLLRELLELIETILVYKLPKINRREIEAMFSLSDLKQTRVYQEALEEGREEGKEEGKEQERLTTVRRMVASGFSLEQIVLASGLDIEEVRQIIESRGDRSDV